MACLGDNTVGAFVEGKLGEREARDVREHLGQCEECRALVRAVMGSTARSSTLTGQVLAETYRVKHLLGSGAMGTVYAGEHLRLTRPVAIKVMGEALRHHADALERFRREAQICSRMGNSHIIDVLDFNTLADGTPFMVMELLEGEDLAQRLAIDGPLPPAMVLAVMKQICSALARAHDEGVLHRDLKPSNIFLCPGDGEHDPLVKVLDFGISKVRGAVATLTGSQEILGTPYYMSPEMAQARHAEVDQRSDLFSLGAIAYEALLCRRAFEADSIPGALYRIVHEEPEPIERLGPQVPAGLSRLVTRLLAKDREQRPPSARAVLESLSQLEPQVTASRPVTDAYAPTIAQYPETLKTGGGPSWRRLMLPGLLLLLGLGGLGVYLLRPPAAPSRASTPPPVSPDLGTPDLAAAPDAARAVPDAAAVRQAPAVAPKKQPRPRRHPRPRRTKPKKIDTDPLL